MNQQITNLLIGIRRWVNGKLEDITYVISSHINELTSRMTTAETKLATIDEGADVNTIETIKVDGVALTPDANKAVDIDLSGKVDKVEGKQLSTEDYTTAEKTKLSGIAEGAQVNVIESISVNGNTATISEKAASITIGEATTSASGVMSAADKTKLDGVASGAQVNVIETVKVNGVALNPDANKAVDVTIPAATVTGVKSSDKVLALDGTELTSTISLSHDSENHLIKLIGKNSEVISSFSTNDFIKDGMLDYAGLHVRVTESSTTTWTPALPAGIIEPSGTDDGTYLVLNWNTGASKSATFINVTSLIDTYTAGTGLTLTNNEFSLNIASSSALGGVKGGSNITIANDGAISADIASASTVGTVKVAAAETSGLALANDGSLSLASITVSDVIDILNTEETA